MGRVWEPATRRDGPEWWRGSSSSSGRSIRKPSSRLASPLSSISILEKPRNPRIEAQYEQTVPGVRISGQTDSSDISGLLLPGAVGSHVLKSSRPKHASDFGAL